MIEIPGYKIHREIDHSDYCHSYSAIQLKTGKTMVVSILTHSTTEYSALKSFFNDVEKKLAHKQFGVITPIKEFIKTQDYTYIISDLLSNSCQQVYKEKEVDIILIFEHIYKIALSLNLYHQVNFYHGGISLDNIYHDTDNTLTLGLAAFNQNFNKKEDNSFDLNKESYKAPEKEISQSKTRDFYALGVVLFELIFKQKPFIANNKEQLDQLKNAGSIIIPNHEYDDLKPIFTALLEPNPIKRLSSAEEFKAIVNHLSIQLPTLSYSIKTLDSPQAPSVITSTDKQQNNKLSNYIYYLVAAGIITVVTALYFMLPNEEIPANDYKESITQDAPSNTQNNISANDSDTSDFNSLLQLTQTALESKKVASSLMAINQALKINPNDIKARRIKEGIELELKIMALIQQANQQIISGNIITPSKNNAIATYRKLQTIAPKSDTRAEQGLNKIADMYHRLALKQLNLSNTESAKSILKESMAALPKNNKLKRLLSRIQSAEASTLKKQRDEQLRQNSVQVKQFTAQSKQEEQRQAQIERNKQFKIDLQNQALREFKVQKENQRKKQLTSLYKDAERSLAETPLTLNAIDNAIDDLKSLEFLSISSARSNPLRRKIDNAYVALSKDRIAIKQYQQARAIIDKGLSTNPKNRALFTLNSQLKNILAKKNLKSKKQALIKPKKAEKELPIFGTF